MLPLINIKNKNIKQPAKLQFVTSTDTRYFDFFYFFENEINMHKAFITNPGMSYQACVNVDVLIIYMKNENTSLMYVFMALINATHIF